MPVETKITVKEAMEHGDRKVRIPGNCIFGGLLIATGGIGALLGRYWLIPAGLLPGCVIPYCLCAVNYTMADMGI